MDPCVVVSIHTYSFERDFLDRKPTFSIREIRFFRTMTYDRSRGIQWFASVDKGFGGHLTGVKKIPFIQKFILKQFEGKVTLVFEKTGGFRSKK